MSNTKHTPGPWYAGQPIRGITVYSAKKVSGYEPIICNVKGYGSSAIRSSEEEEANAHLIVSAPELLEALEGFRAQIAEVDCGDRPYTGFDTELIDHAISKAKGEA